MSSGSRIAARSCACPNCFRYNWDRTMRRAEGQAGICSSSQGSAARLLRGEPMDVVRLVGAAACAAACGRLSRSTRRARRAARGAIPARGRCGRRCRRRDSCVRSRVRDPALVLAEPQAKGLLGHLEFFPAQTDAAAERDLWFLGGVGHSRNPRCNVCSWLWNGFHIVSGVWVETGAPGVQQG